MGLLAVALLLCGSVDVVTLLVPELPGPSTVVPTPRLHLRFNPRTMTLSWNCEENSTSTRCLMVPDRNGPIEKTPRKNECSCTFQARPLHGGATFQVQIETSHRWLQERLLYENPGAEGTGAENFSCVIYEADFMNCTWEKGPAAPADVQYFLYIRDTKGRKERECPRYMRASGTHVGCHLDDLSAIAFWNYFLVNGSSRGPAIRFFDSVLSMKDMERHSPPANVTIHCNASHCLVGWRQPRTKQRLSPWDFQYQLDIQRQNVEPYIRNPLIDVAGDGRNQYCFPSPEPRAKHTVRVRAADARALQWSAWSQPVEFGSAAQEASLLYVYLLVVLGTLVCAGAIFILFKRLLGAQRLFPPIPQIRDKLTDSHAAGHRVFWEEFPPSPGKGEKEEVLTVQEVRPASGGAP